MSVATVALPRPIGVRVRPAPALDGPYDDELPAAVQRVDGSLLLAFPPPDRDAVPLRLAPPAGTAVDASAGAALPDPRPWSRRLTQAMAEVLAGGRPAAQLAGFATLDVLSLLERASGRLQPSRHRPARRPIVTSVHVSQPDPRTAEVCAVVDTGPRRRAIALRLDGVDGRWRCTVLQVG
jgi:hypothetical protein